jgi:outer membrane protein assembly factor BamE
MLMSRLPSLTTLRLACAISAATGLAGCGGFGINLPSIPGVTPYKMEIQQGNFVSQEMMSQLQPGMTKDQVRFALGTPLLTDIFHADRWDYVYWKEGENAGKREQRKLAIYFQEGKLTRIDGDVVAATPQEKEGAK